jgi:hypothetical protein
MGHIWRNPDGSLGAETEEDLARTVDCIRRLVGRGLLWSAQICIIDPVPGSEVGNLVQEHRLQETQDFDDLLQFDRIRLNFRHPTLDAATLDDYYTRGYRAAVLNPRLWWTALRQIEEPCELYALIRLFVFMLRKRLFRIDR